MVNRVKHSKQFKSKLIRLDVEMQEQSDTMLASYDVSTRSETQNYDTSIANNINFPKWCTALAQKNRLHKEGF